MTRVTRALFVTLLLCGGCSQFQTTPSADGTDERETTTMATQKTVKVNPILSEIAQGYQNAELIGTELAPVVPVAKTEGRFLKFGKESFRRMNTVRAPTAKSNRMDFAIGEGEYILREHDLCVPVDLEEREEQADGMSLDLVAPEIAMDVIDLQREIRIATIAQDSAQYPAGHVVTLAGNDQWGSGHADADPFADILAGRTKIRQKTARYPNTLALGAAVFEVLSEHPAVIERLKYSQEGIATEQILARLFKVDRVLVGKALYVDGDESAPTDVWGKNAVLAWVPPRAERRRPAFMYTFRKRGYPMTDDYVEEGGKITIHRTTDKYEAKMVGPDAGFLLKAVVA